MSGFQPNNSVISKNKCEYLELIYCATTKTDFKFACFVGQLKPQEHLCLTLHIWQECEDRAASTVKSKHGEATFTVCLIA